MSITSRIRSAWGALKAAGEDFTMRFPRSGFARWFLPRTRFNFTKEVGEGLGSSVVMAPLLWIMRTFPEAPMVLIRDEETIRDHEMLDLIRRPNEYYSGHLLNMGTIISFIVNGNAYWLIETDRNLKPSRLWYTPHQLIKPVWPQDGSEFISHYEYSPNGTPEPIPRENVVHFRYGLDPDNTRKGLSPLGTLLREVFTDDEAANFSAALLRNMGVPGLIVGPDWGKAGAGSAISETDKIDAKEYIKQNTTGDKRGEPLVFTAPTKVQQFGFSPKDLDLGQLRRIPEERVTACLGIPSAVVGFGSGLAQTKVGATMKELREMAFESGIIPLQRLFSEEIATQLLPHYEPDPRTWEVGYDLTRVRILQEDQTALTDRTTKLVKERLITVAEGRQRLSWETGPEHEIWLQPFNVIVVPANGSVEDAVAATAPAEKLPEEDEDPEPKRYGRSVGQAAKAIAFEASSLASFGVKAAVPAEQLATFVAAQERDVDLLSGPFSRELASRFRSYGARAAEIFLELEEAGELPGILEPGAEVDELLLRRLPGSEKAAGDPPEIEIAIDKIMARLEQDFDKPEVLGYSPQYLKVAAATMGTIETTLGIVANLPDPVEAAVFDAAGKRLGLVDLSGQTKDRLFEIIKESRDLGEGAAQLGLRIKDEIPRGPWPDERTRGLVIARTETKYAQNVSTIATYRNVDGVNATQVVDAQKGPTDEYCEELNGRVVSFADAQVLADTEHPNGTRSFAPYYGENPPIESIEMESAFEARTEG